MTKKYAFFLFSVISVIIIYACSNDQDDANNDYEPISPVTVDLTQVPYEKLSDYKFFQGNLKDQNPSLNVIPYAPASILFSDYAHKKRFIWMPTGSKATYVGDDKILEFPVGSAIIKTFYYDNVQPSNTTQILETRIMIRKSDGWIFADYVWNDEQTEAYFDLAGSFKPISWKDENDVVKSTNYRIPSEVECNVCHKTKTLENNISTDIQIPIGIKPQNLNYNFNYGNEYKNQLTKWVELGYLESNFSLPSAANTVVDYSDETQPLDLRARSYVDINCAHCHQPNGHCDYRPMKLNFSATGLPNGEGLTNMGVCVPTQDMQDFPPALASIITPANPNRSMLYYRINTTDESYRMPLHGRTVIHEEGVALMEQWINSLTTPCN